MRCKHLIERNGYFTGKKCSKESTFMVTLDNAEVGLPMCTQHKNMTVKARWLKPESVVVTKIESNP